MSALTLVIVVVLAAAAVLVVCLPFLREPEVDDDRLDAPTEEDERRLTLAEERDRALAALKELEFDHRTGKVDDADYRASVGPLRRAAAQALQALDAAKAASAQEDLPEQEQVQADDQSGNGPGPGRGEAVVDERAHEVAPRREPDERHEGERDPEGQHHL